jgi:hypothetical protein
MTLEGHLLDEFATAINEWLGPKWKAVVSIGPEDNCDNHDRYIDILCDDLDKPPAQVYFSEVEGMDDQVVCIPYVQDYLEQERESRFLCMGHPQFFTQLQEWVEWVQVRFNE